MNVLEEMGKEEEMAGVLMDELREVVQGVMRIVNVVEVVMLEVVVAVRRLHAVDSALLAF